MKTAATTTPSYHSGWSLAHGRMAAADAERSAWLDAKLAGESFWRREAYTPEHKARMRQAKRKQAAAFQADPSAPRCIVCGQPKGSNVGKKCQACRDLRLCKCGKVLNRKVLDCPQCRVKP